MSFDVAEIHVPYLYETLAFLTLVVFIVPIFKKINISPILGFLGAGTLIGPYGLGWLTDIVAVQHFAEIGVIFLLFTIGLELSFGRLKNFAALIFGLGSLQVLINALLIGALAFAWGNSINASVVIGLCLALSSTAMVMQILEERKESSSVTGRASLAILLFQDLAVVPILILVPILADANSETSLLEALGVAFIKAAITIGLLIILGRFALSFAFRAISRVGNIDVFTALTLLVILATAAITGLAGLSMALGAFLAGLLLAETEFRHQIESEIEPFKGLFLGLFFIGVGMNLDFAAAFENGVWVILSVVGLLTIKTIITTLIAKLSKLSWPNAIRTGLMVSQGGEFAFVVIGQATLSYQVVDSATGQFMVVVAGLSMASTPFMAMLGDAIVKRFPKTPVRELPDQQKDGHVIIVGFGRVGQLVARVLYAKSIDYIAIDSNADRVRALQPLFANIHFADASKKDRLVKSGIDTASALLITIDDPAKAQQLVEMYRHLYPELSIIVRARDELTMDNLITGGATHAVPETLAASYQLSAQVLHAKGIPNEETYACIEHVKKQQA